MSDNTTIKPQTKRYNGYDAYNRLNNTNATDEELDLFFAILDSTPHLSDRKIIIAEFITKHKASSLD